VTTEAARFVAVFGGWVSRISPTGLHSSHRTSVIDPVDGGAHLALFSYDLTNHLTGVVYPDGSSVSFGYDARGRRISATDQNNKTTTYTYDDADRLTAVTDPTNHTTQYGYDTDLTSITDANQHTTSLPTMPTDGSRAS
jgi:YD repeat-containing protein